jgi:hypothetical protein
MRKNIDLDDELIAAAMAATGLPTKKATAEEGLRRQVRRRRHKKALANKRERISPTPMRFHDDGSEGRINARRLPVRSEVAIIRMFIFDRHTIDTHAALTIDCRYQYCVMKSRSWFVKIVLLVLLPLGNSARPAAGITKLTVLQSYGASNSLNQSRHLV